MIPTRNQQRLLAQENVARVSIPRLGRQGSLRAGDGWGPDGRGRGRGGGQRRGEGTKPDLPILISNTDKSAVPERPLQTISFSGNSHASDKLIVLISLCFDRVVFEVMTL